MENTDNVETKIQHTKETHTVKVEEPVVKQTVTSASEPKSSNKGVMAIISLVLGIIGLCAWFLPICGGPLAIIGLVLGIIGIKSDKKVMSIIGLVLNIMALIAAIINGILGAVIGITQYNDLFNNTKVNPFPTGIELPLNINNNTDSNTQNNSNDLQLLDIKPYINIENGFSINPPKNWTMIDGSDYGTLITFKSNESTLNKALVPNINVVSEPAQGYLLDEYVEASIDGLQTYLENYVLVNQDKIKLDGVNATILTGKFTQEGIDIQNMQMIYIKNDTAYIVTATVEASDWNNNYEDLFTASFNTFMVN